MSHDHAVKVLFEIIQWPIVVFICLNYGFHFLQQILLIRSRNKQNYEHADENKQIVDKKTQGSLLEYRVSI